MSLENNVVPNSKRADAFAGYFDSKVTTNKVNIDVNVYNGKRKVISNEVMFMDHDSILACIKTLKIKNCEGHDRIPQRILVDGADYLVPPLTALFEMIYRLNELPDQWMVAKVFPVFKKGNKNKIENYRPISNLCSTSKFFEKLILKRILEIQENCKTDLTGNEQHGFKKAKSTSTAGLIIQSIISRAVDTNNYALMASIDLTAAFDLVDTKLLLKRIKIIGLPPDIVRLIELWLTRRSFYVSIDGINSLVIDLEGGTIQGSILGPLLYAIYVSPLYDLLKITTFADDNFVIRWNTNMEVLINEMKKDLEIMTKWLKNSGMKVNDSKTEICVFHRLDAPQISLTLNNCRIKSINSMNVLGVQFDSKLSWSHQVSKCIKKANSTLHAIRLIKGYFTPKELLDLITANFYSTLYYNSEIWLLPNLNPFLKNQLLAASASALKLCTPSYNLSISYLDLHLMNKRAIPSKITLYKHALLLYKIFNEKTPPLDWLKLNFNQVQTTRQKSFECIGDANYKIGKNILSNRLCNINKKIPLNWLNQSISTYKVHCKKLFL